MCLTLGLSALKLGPAMTQITKRTLRTALGPGTRDVAIADFFGITQAAVSQWGEDDPIPEMRALQAMHKRPDLFPPAATSAQPVDAEGASRAA